MKWSIPFFISLAASLVQAAKPLDIDRRCDGVPSILFSPVFTLCLPAELVNQSAIIKADNLIIKFYDGSHFYGQVITPELDALPASFDMRLYPEYAFGMRAPNDLPSDQREKASNSVAVLKQRYGSLKPMKTETGKFTIYLLSGKEGSEAFVVINGKSDQVLQVGFSGIDQNKVQQILKGFK